MEWYYHFYLSTVQHLNTSYTTAAALVIYLLLCCWGKNREFKICQRFKKFKSVAKENLERSSCHFTPMDCRRSNHLLKSDFYYITEWRVAWCVFISSVKSTIMSRTLLLFVSFLLSVAAVIFSSLRGLYLNNRKCSGYL